MVVPVITGVVNEVPVPSAVPPVEAAYQLSVPAEPVAPSVTLPLPQVEAGVVLVMFGTVFTVASTCKRAEGQLPVEVST